MELIDNTVWVVQGDNRFAIFSTQTFAEEYKREEIEKWEKSITFDNILPRLNNLTEIQQNRKNYPDIIFVGKDHYELIRGMSSHPQNGTKQYYYYNLLSNADWDKCYQEYVDSITIEAHVILK